MRDEWNRDPETWEKRSLVARLESLRKWYCTGPGAQSASVVGHRVALNNAIREAIEYIRERGDK